MKRVWNGRVISQLRRAAGSLPKSRRRHEQPRIRPLRSAKRPLPDAGTHASSSDLRAQSTHVGKLRAISPALVDDRERLRPSRRPQLTPSGRHRAGSPPASCCHRRNTSRSSHKPAPARAVAWRTSAGKTAAPPQSDLLQPGPAALRRSLHPECAPPEHHAVAAIAHIQPQRNPLGIKLPEAKSPRSGLDAVSVGGSPIPAREIPRHRPLRNQTAPRQVAIAPFPCVAEAEQRTRNGNRSTASGDGLKHPSEPRLESPVHRSPVTVVTSTLRPVQRSPLRLSGKESSSPQ